MEFFVFIMWLLFSLGVASFAKARGRSYGGALVGAMLCSPLLAFIVVALSPNLADRQRFAAAEFALSDNQEREQREAQARQQEAAERQRQASAIRASELVTSFEQLAQLRAHGMVTDAEYAARKQQLIGGLRSRTVVEPPETFLAAFLPLIDTQALSRDELAVIKSVVFPPQQAPARPQTPPAQAPARPQTPSAFQDPFAVVAVAARPAQAADAAPATWYLSRDEGPPLGPFTAAQLVAGVRNGQVANDAGVQRVGTQGWLPLFTVPELRQPIAPTAAPVTTQAAPRLRSGPFAALLVAVPLVLLGVHAMVFSAGSWALGALLIVGAAGAIAVVRAPKFREHTAAELTKTFLGNRLVLAGSVAVVLLAEAVALAAGIPDRRDRATVAQALANSDPCAVGRYAAALFKSTDQEQAYAKRLAECQAKREQDARVELEAQRQRIEQHLSAGRLEDGDVAWLAKNESQDHADVATRIASGTLTTADMARTSSQVPLGTPGWNLFVRAVARSPWPWSTVNARDVSPELVRSLRDASLKEDVRRALHTRAEAVATGASSRCTSTAACDGVHALCELDVSFGNASAGPACAAVAQAYDALAKRDAAVASAKFAAANAKAAADEKAAAARAAIEARAEAAKTAAADRASQAKQARCDALLEAFHACNRHCDDVYQPVMGTASDDRSLACEDRCRARYAQSGCNE